MKRERKNSEEKEILLEQKLDEKVDKKYQKEDKFILVPYHTINGEGLLKCIKPEKVYIEKIGYKTNLLVAFSSSPSTINGVEVLLHKDLMKG